MKTTLMALLAMGLCLPLAGAEKKKTGVEEDGYKGRVKSVKESRFSIEEKFGKPVRVSGGINSTYKYDEKGNWVELVKYDASGEIKDKVTSKYDEKGNRTEWVEYDANGEIKDKVTYKYDEKGNW